MSQFPAWFYGPSGQAQIFQRHEDVPIGWHDSPARFAEIKAAEEKAAKVKADLEAADAARAKAEAEAKAAAPDPAPEAAASAEEPAKRTKRVA